MLSICRAIKATIKLDSAFLKTFFQSHVHGFDTEFRACDLVWQLLHEGLSLLRNVDPSDAFSFKGGTGEGKADVECEGKAPLKVR